MTDRTPFAVYAIRYATRAAQRGEHFYAPGPRDPHDAPMPMDYFVWAAVSPAQTVIVDTGFTAEVAARRGRILLRSPMSGLAALGIDCHQAPLVILTHLHYDHVGNLAAFPRATFVVQQEELAFWTGRYASRGAFRTLIEPDDVVALVRANFEGRTRLVSGVTEVVPGVTVHRVGGHAAGLQVVRVETNRGGVVLASDATHFYANIAEDRPFSIVSNLPEMYAAFDTVRELAGSLDQLVPGHDPLVMERFPPAGDGLAGIAVRIA